MRQGQLFHDTPAPLARNTDPQTSHDAARAETASGRAACHRRIALETLRKHPGCTSGELALWCTLKRHQAARRLSDLKSAGLAVHGDARLCRIVRRSCVTWWPANQASGGGGLLWGRFVASIPNLSQPPIEVNDHRK